MANKYLEAFKYTALKEFRAHRLVLPATIILILAFGYLITLKPTSYKQNTQTQPEKVTVTKTPKKTPPPVNSTPASAPATTSTPAVTKKSAPPSNTPPTPIPASSPSPGTGVSSLSPAPSGSGGSSTSGSNTSGTGFTPVNYSSLNWAGYMVNTGTLTTVSGSWIATSPTGNSSSTSADASWIGIGGVNTNDLIQVGTDNTVSSSGVVTTSAFYELLPAPAEQINAIIVSPGDSITASITQTSAGQWTITIKDNTDNETYSASTTYSSSYSSAEWIEEDPSFLNGQLVPLDNFGTANFSGCATTVNGTLELLDNATPSSITMVNRSNQNIAVPSSLISNGFRVSWQSPG